MKIRTIGILVGLLTVSTLAVPLSSFAAEETRIFVETAPPQAKESLPPTPTKVGYVWSTGYWTWNGKSYDWTEGSWVAVAQPTQKWVEPTWTKQDNKWYFTAGHWE